MAREGGEAPPLLPSQYTQQQAVHLHRSFSPAPELCLEHYTNAPSSMFKQNTGLFL